MKVDGKQWQKFDGKKMWLELEQRKRIDVDGMC